MSFMKKITITTILVILFILIILIATPNSHTSLFQFVATMLAIYSLLLIVTLGAMVRALLPKNISKPLSHHWIIVGWVLFIMGYIPGGLAALYSYTHSWHPEDLILLLVFSGPFWIYFTFKIKKKYVLKSVDPLCEEDA